VSKHSGKLSTAGLLESVLGAEVVLTTERWELRHGFEEVSVGVDFISVRERIIPHAFRENLVHELSICHTHVVFDMSVKSER